MRELFLGTEPIFTKPSHFALEKENKKRKGKNLCPITQEQLVVESIEASPYYWWWYALTLNNDYYMLTLLKFGEDRAFCGLLFGKDFSQTNRHDFLAIHRNLPSGLDSERKERYERIRSMELQKVFDDFGDLRYEGDRHTAFNDWWDKKIPLRNDDSVCSRFAKKIVTKGEYLFAEPLIDGRMLIVDNVDGAAASLNSDTHTLISIPTNASRQYIEKHFARLMARHHVAYRERTVRDIEDSKALYRLSKRQSGDKLKTKFQVMEHFDKNPDTSNYAASSDLDISVTVRDELGGTEYESNTQKISRMKSEVRNIIDNVSKGTFP